MSKLILKWRKERSLKWKRWPTLKSSSSDNSWMGFWTKGTVNVASSPSISWVFFDSNGADLSGNPNFSRMCGCFKANCCHIDHKVGMEWISTWFFFFNIYVNTMYICNSTLYNIWLINDIIKKNSLQYLVILGNKTVM